MDTPIKIKKELVVRVDQQADEFRLGTRQNLANTLIRKGLDFLETNGYEALLKIPSIGGRIETFIDGKKCGSKKPLSD
jgi:hypothetical protein